MKQRNQLSRKEIDQLLTELGVKETVDAAIAGDQTAVQRLSLESERNQSVRLVLELLMPRRTPQNQRRREALSPVEQGGLRFTGKVSMVQGGSPGLKKRG